MKKCSIRHLMGAVIFIAAMCYSVPCMSEDLPKVIQICDDGTEWPPFSYFERIDGNKSDKVIGFSVDVVREIFDPIGTQFTVNLIPWKRCLNNVETENQYQMLLNASYSYERSQNFLMSVKYYETVPHYFYSQISFPNGLNIKSKMDMKHYKICGILGYNYTPYGFDASEVDTGARDFDALISKINLKRCDLFVEQFEILAGFGATGKNYLSDKNIKYKPVPDMQSTPFHMMFPKSNAGQNLKSVIDKGITELEKSGRLKALLHKYVPESK